MEGLGGTEGRIGGVWRGTFTFHSTTTHHIPPLPVPCLRPGPLPAEGKEYGGIRWYRRVMAGSGGWQTSGRRGQVRRRRGVGVGGIGRGGGGGGVAAEASAGVA